MSKPKILLDPGWRRMDELFSPTAKETLFASYDVVWGKDGAIPPGLYAQALPQAEVVIAAEPVIRAQTLETAAQLRAVIEVSGAFPDSIDYAACAAKRVEVLTCAPGFRQSAAEMGLAMALSGARGLVTEHEAFRRGQEHWLNDNAETDFTLYGARVGFVGFGQIAQELTRLMSPFAPQIRAYDPWLPEAVADGYGIALVGLEELMRWARCLFVTAVPTAENFRLLDAGKFALLQDHALVVLLSRAHLVDFDALIEVVGTGRIRAAIDVFPNEPVAADDPCRRLPNLVLSPHRAAAVAGGRHLIGDMILSDLSALFSADPSRRLGRADARTIGAMAGASDATQVAQMSLTRE